MRPFLAFFWLIIGGGYLFLWPYVGPDPRTAGTFYDRLPIAVFALALFSYNIFRWRLERIRDRPQLPTHTNRREKATNPEFDFSDPKTDADPKSDQPSQ